MSEIIELNVSFVTTVVRNNVNPLNPKIQSTVFVKYIEFNKK